MRLVMPIYGKPRPSVNRWFAAAPYISEVNPNGDQVLHRRANSVRPVNLLHSIDGQILAAEGFDRCLPAFGQGDKFAVQPDKTADTQPLDHSLSAGA